MDNEFDSSRRKYDADSVLMQVDAETAQFLREIRDAISEEIRSALPDFDSSSDDVSSVLKEELRKFSDKMDERFAEIEIKLSTLNRQVGKILHTLEKTAKE